MMTYFDDLKIIGVTLSFTIGPGETSISVFKL